MPLNLFREGKECEEKPSQKTLRKMPGEIADGYRRLRKSEKYTEKRTVAFFAAVLFCLRTGERKSGR